MTKAETPEAAALAAESSLAEPMPIGRHLRRTLTLALPVMASRAGLVVMMTVSNLLLRDSGALDQAAFAASIFPQQIVQTINIGLMISTTILTAQAMGAGEKSAGGRIWRQSLVVAFFASLLLSSPLLFSETVLGLLEQPAEIIPEAAHSLRLLALGIPGFLLYAVCTFFLEGIHRPVVGMVVTWCGNAVNLVLAYGLIHGLWFLPEMGQTGAALAITLTRWAMFATILGYLLTMKDRDDFALTRRSPLRLADIRRQIGIGLPLALGIALETSCFSGTIAIGGWLGKESLATMSYTINYASFVYMLTIGLATAAAVRVGNAVGRNSPVDLRRAGWVALGLETLIMSAIAIATILYADNLAQLYSLDPTVSALLKITLVIAGLMTIVDGIQGVLMGALRGAGDAKVPTLIYGLVFWGIGIPFGYILGYRLGLGTAWLMWGLVLSLAVGSAALAWRFHRIGTGSLRRL